MADGQRIGLSTPVALDGVNVTGANTAALDLDVDIIISKGLRVKLLLLEVLPGLGAVDLEAGELLGDVGHRVHASIVTQSVSKKALSSFDSRNIYELVEKVKFKIGERRFKGKGGTGIRGETRRMKYL